MLVVPDSLERNRDVKLIRRSYKNGVDVGIFAQLLVVGVSLGVVRQFVRKFVHPCRVQIAQSRDFAVLVPRDRPSIRFPDSHTHNRDTNLRFRHIHPSGVCSGALDLQNRHAIFDPDFRWLLVSQIHTSVNAGRTCNADA